jgi:hypothetical protein
MFTFLSFFNDGDWRQEAPVSSVLLFLYRSGRAPLVPIYIRVPIYKGWTKKWLSLDESSTHIILEGTLLSSTAASLLQKQETEKSTQIELFDAPRSTCIKEQPSYILLQPNCWNFQDEMLTYNNTTRYSILYWYVGLVCSHPVEVVANQIFLRS